MPCPIQHFVKTHRSVPIQQMHNLRQIARHFRLHQIMHMIAHNAYTVELKVVFLFAFVYGIQQDLSTFLTHQFEFAIVTPGGDVVAIVGKERSDFSHARLYGAFRYENGIENVELRIEKGANRLRKV